MVVDPSGAWLTGWEARHERLSAPHMRTPNTQHPHASPLALPDFAAKHDRQRVGGLYLGRQRLAGCLSARCQPCGSLAAGSLATRPASQHHHHCRFSLTATLLPQELVPVVRGFAPVPTAALFSDFCRKKVVGKLPAALRAPLRDAVVRLEALEGRGEPGAPSSLCLLPQAG